jgi:hypothetical protein
MFHIPVTRDYLPNKTILPEWKEKFNKILWYAIRCPLYFGYNINEQPYNAARLVSFLALIATETGPMASITGPGHRSCQQLVFRMFT